jgi:hypothetical protein
MDGHAAAARLPKRILADVKAALSVAAAMSDKSGPPGPIHAARSQNFVAALADRLRTAYRDDARIAVLSRDYDGHGNCFGKLNELLFDILVCRTDTTPSANGSKQLTVITGGILAIESELDGSSREAMYDFNKLVLCASEYKLFIGPRVRDEAAFLGPLGAGAARCGGSVFAVLVPQPSEWKAGPPLEVSGYRWLGGKWTAL